MTDLLKLAERCEAATAANYALECDIAKAMGYFVPSPPTGGGAVIPTGRIPNYTASIEAAMSLVDPRALWAIGSMEEGLFCRLCWPQPNGGFTGGYFEGQAETVPLSICVAALRARSEAAAVGGR